MSRKKRVKQRKREKLRNKKLVKKYPWLTPIDSWTGRPYKDYDYSWTLLDCMPDGWRFAFGDMMCEEIDALLRRANFVKKYRIVEVKEKYGGLRWYDNGVPESIHEEMSHVISKYECISECCCIVCGKPDVKMTNAGWLEPLCKPCYERCVNSTRTYEEVTDTDDPGRLPDTYTVRRFSTEGSTDTTYDISETSNKVRMRYERIQKRRSRRRLRQEGL